MANKFLTVSTTLSAAVAAGGTFTVGYPTGTDENSFAVYGHKALAIGNVMSSPGDFTLSFGTGLTITFTYGSGKTTMPAGTKVSIDLNMPAESVREAPKLVLDNPQVSMAALVRMDFGSPLIADTNAIFESASIAAATDLEGALIVATAAQVDVAGTGQLGMGLAQGGAAFGRCIIAAWTNTAVLTFTGTDFEGNAMVEVSASGTSHNGTKAFATLTKVSVSTDVTSATVGTRDILGLGCYVGETDAAVLELEDGTDATSVNITVGDGLAATGTTGDVRGTWDPNGTLDGNVNFVAYFAVPDPTYQGVAQFTS